MIFVPCPACSAPVENPHDLGGEERTDPWNIVTCPVCLLSFDYDDQKISEQDNVDDT